MQVSDSVNWLDTSYKLLLTAKASAGRLGAFESTAPAGSGPPRHIHHSEDETFYILSGKVDFWVEGETFTRGPGEMAFVPRGVNHTFQVHSDGPSRHLVILSPGGFEEFFPQMAAGQYAIPDDMERITAIAERYNLSFTGPPLGME
jgi:quercetin dioxygenase-like cupin family protein